MPLTFTGMSCPWWALSVVNTYEISECEVVCRHMAHFMALRRLPTLYCSTIMAMHSLQKQCPQVSTAHYQSKTPSEYIHTNTCDKLIFVFILPPDPVVEHRLGMVLDSDRQWTYPETESINTGITTSNATVSFIYTCTTSTPCRKDISCKTGFFLLF